MDIDYRVLTVTPDSRSPYVEREIIISGPAGQTREQVHAAANRWLASVDAPEHLRGCLSAAPGECFPLSD